MIDIIDIEREGYILPQAYLYDLLLTYTPFSSANVYINLSMDVLLRYVLTCLIKYNYTPEYVHVHS